MKKIKQSDIVAKIRKLGYKVTVLNSSPVNRRGIPDTLVSVGGKAMFIEIKIDSDKMSKLQKKFQYEFWQCSFVLHYDSKLKLFKGNYLGYPDMVEEFAELKNKLNLAEGK
jgi:hypothetical protein